MTNDSISRVEVCGILRPTARRSLRVAFASMIAGNTMQGRTILSFDVSNVALISLYTHALLAKTNYTLAKHKKRTTASICQCSPILALTALLLLTLTLRHLQVKPSVA